MSQAQICRTSGTNLTRARLFRSTREAVAVAEQSIRCCAVLPYRFEFIFVCFDVAFLCVGHVARALLCYL